MPYVLSELAKNLRFNFKGDREKYKWKIVYENRKVITTFNWILKRMSQVLHSFVKNAKIII